MCCSSIVVFVENGLLTPVIIPNDLLNTGVLHIKTENGWTTICDDYWSQEASDVVCKQLGFRYVKKKTHGLFLFLNSEFTCLISCYLLSYIYFSFALLDPNTVNIADVGELNYYKFECDGTESSLSQCNHVIDIDRNVCSKYEAVSIQCVCKFYLIKLK